MGPVILVVEENDGVRDAMCQWATRMFPEGKLVKAHSGREALRRVRNWLPKIVLLDVNLGDMPAGVAKKFIEAMSPASEVVLFSPEDAPGPAGRVADRPATRWTDPVPYRPSLEAVSLN